MTQSPTTVRATVDEGATPLLRLGTAFCDAQALLSAVEVGVFTQLAHGPATAAQLAEALDLHPRPLPDLLDALVALGVLDRIADAPGPAAYANGPAADAYLVPSRRTYIGGFLRLNQRMLYPTWGRLTETVRTGESQLAHQLPGGTDPFELLYADTDRLRNFVGGMGGLAADIGPAIAAAFPWTDVATFADLGGAAGAVSTALLTEHPHLHGTTFDLAPMEPLFDERVAELGLDPARAMFRAGDFFLDPLPRAGVLIIGHVLHDWPVERRQELLVRAADALAPGGTLLIYDMMVTGEPSRDAFPLLQSLNMALTVGAGEYTIAECCSWVAEAGLVVVSVDSLTARDTLLRADKPV